MGCLNIYIEEINMGYKLKIRDDSRFDGVLLFEEIQTLIVHLKVGEDEESLKLVEEINNQIRVED
jgi:hypothetical protein